MDFRLLWVPLLVGNVLYALALFGGVGAAFGPPAVIVAAPVIGFLSLYTVAKLSGASRPVLSVAVGGVGAAVVGVSFEAVAESFDPAEAGAMAIAAATGFVLVLHGDVRAVRWLRVPFVILVGTTATILPEPRYADADLRLVLILSIPTLLAVWEQASRLVVRASVDRGAARAQSA